MSVEIPVKIPVKKTRAIKTQFGKAGEQWLADLPSVLGACASRWDLVFELPYEGGWPTNVVLKVTRSGEPLVLKTGYPQPELFTEMQVLQKWRGRTGCVQLLDCDETAGIMLMQRLEPGLEFRHAHAGSARSSVSIDLFNSVPMKIVTDEVSLPYPSLPYYRDWVERAFAAFRVDYEDGVLKNGFLKHIEKAESIFVDLDATHEETWLLHGDLHHENMLLDESTGWTAIDPKGILGAKVLECGRFMHNFIADEVSGDCSAPEILRIRADTLCLRFKMTLQDPLWTR